jgi:hypothetical protein
MSEHAAAMNVSKLNMFAMVKGIVEMDPMNWLVD